MNKKEMTKSPNLITKLLPSKMAPALTPQPGLIMAKKKRRLLIGGGALVITISLFFSFQLGIWQGHHTNNEKIQVLGKLYCNRFTSSNELSDALQASSRSNWPSVTTINGREYVCVSTYKIDVTDLGR